MRAKADHKPPSTHNETARQVKRDSNGFFQKGTKPGPGRPPGSPNKVPSSVKQVMQAICDGALQITYLDPLTGEPTTGPLAHLMAEKLGEGLRLPAKEALPYIETMLEYGIGRPKIQVEASTEQKRQIPRIIFLSPPVDPLAKPGDPPKPARILGQIAGPDGEIIDFKTGKVVVPAPGQPSPVGDGLGEGDDRLELAEDVPSICLACSGSGRQRIGFGSRTERCDECGGTGRMQ